MGRGRSRALAGVLATAAAALAPAGGVGADQPADMSITAHTERGCPTATSCVFAASGAIVDSGTVEGELIRVGAENAPVTGYAQYVIAFHGGHGSLTVRLQARLSLTDVPWQLQEDAQWTVIDGSGDYTGARGQGSATGIRDFRLQSLDLTYSGRLQLP